jgi:DNA transformation protein
MLARAGITTQAQLRRAGSLGAYRRARRANANVSLSLLWALEGSLTGVPWQTVARDHGTSLLIALEVPERGFGPAIPAGVNPRAKASRTPRSPGSYVYGSSETEPGAGQGY